MPKLFNEAVRATIGQAISRIESQSRAEVVVVIRDRVAGHSEYPLATGSGCAFLALTYFRFAPELFDEWVIYAGTILAFVSAALLTGGIPGILRSVVGRKRLRKAADIMARACFQKGGIHHTRAETGVLILVAVLERQVVIIADRGVESAIPPGEWERIQRGFEVISGAKNLPQALITRLEDLRAVFERYLPPMAGDVNELPDQLDIQL